MNEMQRRRRQENTIPRTMVRTCIALKVRLLSRAVTAIYDEALRPHGLKASQMNLLAAASALGRAAPAQLGALLDLEKSTLSRNVDRLVSRGWIERQPVEDGRSHRLEVTTAGRGALVDAFADWKGAQRRVRRMLGARNLEAVERIAARLPRPRAAAR